MVERVRTNTLQHIAIIMDGNGRWAAARGKERLYGHHHGKEAVKEAIRGCIHHGVPYLTLYAFSTENWARPQEEVEGLMSLLSDSIVSDQDELVEEGLHLRLLGDITRLDKHLQQQLKEVCQATQHGTKLTLCIALNYGGRQEIIQAVQRYSEHVKKGECDPTKLTMEEFSHYLDTEGIPDPDLLIRTSGESRLSNFLLWQLAYTELLFLPVYWPDFTEAHLDSAIQEYAQRARRYGGL